MIWQYSYPFQSNPFYNVATTNFIVFYWGLINTKWKKSGIHFHSIPFTLIHFSKILSRHDSTGMSGIKLWRSLRHYKTTSQSFDYLTKVWLINHLKDCNSTKAWLWQAGQELRRENLSAEGLLVLQRFGHKKTLLWFAISHLMGEHVKAGALIRCGLI